MTDTEKQYGTPQFVNELGVKWWPDKLTTDYAQARLKNATVWIVEKPDGHRTRVLIIGGEVVAEHQSLDAMGAKIDILAFAEAAP